MLINEKPTSISKDSKKSSANKENIDDNQIEIDESTI